jgi:hypothetical protein
MTQLVYGVKDILVEMSITPSRMGTFTSGFSRPVDMGDEHDAIPRSDALFPLERRVVSGFQRRKNNTSLELSE